MALGIAMVLERNASIWPQRGWRAAAGPLSRRRGNCHITTIVTPLQYHHNPGLHGRAGLHDKHVAAAGPIRQANPLYVATHAQSKRIQPSDSTAKQINQVELDDSRLLKAEVHADALASRIRIDVRQAQTSTPNKGGFRWRMTLPQDIVNLPSPARMACCGSMPRC